MSSNERLTRGRGSQHGPADVRRKNFPPKRIAFTAATGLDYDNLIMKPLDKAQGIAGYAKPRADQKVHVRKAG
jgi:hypothetical protein